MHKRAVYDILIPGNGRHKAAAAAGDPDAGFYAFALTDQLPAGELELCFAYRSNGHNALIRTGQTVGGAPL